MIIQELKINQFRNFGEASCFFADGFNLIYGDNGSGKTSLLEAIYLLGTGHSFRTRETQPLIHFGAPDFTIFARSFIEDTISINKAKTGLTRARINNTPCRTSSELAHWMPCQIFYQDIFNIIESGPSVRRHILDWGLFHVEPNYFDVWKKLKRVVKQRNTLLKQKVKLKELSGWDQQLVELSVQLDNYRRQYFEKWMSYFYDILSCLSDIDVQIEYFKGWLGEQPDALIHLLEIKYDSDIQRQYTQVGAHQADLKILPAKPGKAKLIFSRGQQKIILMALKLAQTKFLKKKCIYLFDDLCAELDDKHIGKVFDYLQSVDGQYFVTSTSYRLARFVNTSSVGEIYIDNGFIKA
tara:strand:- start:51 stop:1109 length:1059 start_codon:yes stop_codon:yes gene_type:complete